VAFLRGNKAFALRGVYRGGVRTGYKEVSRMQRCPRGVDRGKEIAPVKNNENGWLRQGEGMTGLSWCQTGENEVKYCLSLTCRAWFKAERVRPDKTLTWKRKTRDSKPRRKTRKTWAVMINFMA